MFMLAVFFFVMAIFFGIYAFVDNLSDSMVPHFLVVVFVGASFVCTVLGVIRWVLDTVEKFA